MEQILKSFIVCISTIKNNPSHCAYCQKRQCSLIKDLNIDELMLINDKRIVKNFKRGDFIFKVGQKSTALLTLSKGKVKITKQGDIGNEMIIELKKLGNFLGFESLSSESIHSTNAIALNDVEVCYINKEKYLQVLESNSDFSKDIIKHFANRISYLEERLLNISKKHLRGRMAEALLLVNDAFGISPSDDTLASPLIRAEYAALSNMTTSNAIRILSEFNKDGIILLENKQIKLLRIDQLTKISTS